MAKIVGVRFRPVGKIYYFSPLDIPLELGDGVIVETARGVEFGKVAIAPREEEDKKIVQPLKPILRKATVGDYKQIERNEQRRPQAMKDAAARIAKHKLDMKLVDVEFTFDNSKVIFYFTAEGRVDFRELVKDLASCFKIRIELRQIGIRDETKMRGGLAPCGRVCCCAQHLGDFERVSIKMAKTQCLSLNPTKISGLCGRLMCCLAYENDHYTQASKKMPVIGTEVVSPDGKGVVVANNLLKLTSRVKRQLPDGSFEFKEYPADKLKAQKTIADTVRDDKDEHIKEIHDE